MLAGPKTKASASYITCYLGEEKARAIAPEPLNIYLGMQVCYQGQTASTLPSHSRVIYLPEVAGGGGNDSEEKETGREREGDAKTLQLFFVFLSACIFPPHSPRAETSSAGGGDGRSKLFFVFFFPASNLSAQGKVMSLLNIHMTFSFFSFFKIPIVSP